MPIGGTDGGRHGDGRDGSGGGGNQGSGGRDGSGGEGSGGGANNSSGVTPTTTVPTPTPLTEAEKAAIKLAEQANFAREEANRINQEALDFQVQQYDDWKALYGDIEQNLSDYYTSLGPERIVSMGLQEQQKAYQQTSTQIKQNLAQRGIGDSKFAAYAQTSLDTVNNYSAAATRANADQLVNEQKSAFLSIGLPQQQNNTSNVNAAYSNSANSYTSQYGSLLNRQNNLDNIAANRQNNLDNIAANRVSSTQRIAEIAGKVFTGYAIYAVSDIRIKNIIRKVGSIQGHNVYLYELKDSPGDIRMGVIAQEVEELVPDAVVDVDGVKHVKYFDIFEAI